MYFVQFYHNETLMWDRKTEVTTFKNGFSSVWNRCEKLGKIIWVNAQSKKSETFDYPCKTAYVSVYYKNELFKVIKWAKENPGIHFHIGGPIVDTWTLSKKLEGPIPNLTSHPKVLIEELLFNERVAPLDDWNLKIPSDIKTKHIFYNFSIAKKNGCWWRRCKYCKQKSVPIYINYKHIPVIDFNATKHIWINSYCIRPRDLTKIYSNLPNRKDVRYSTYLKLTEPSIRSLHEALAINRIEPRNLAFNVGIECASDRLLSIFDRGVTLNEYINGMNFLLRLGCKVHINLIFRLGILKESDIRDTRRFVHSLMGNDLSNLSASIYRLHISKERPLWKYLVNKRVPLKPTYSHVWDSDIYNVKCNKNQMALENEMLSIYKNMNMNYLWNTIPEGE